MTHAHESRFAAAIQGDRVASDKLQANLLDNPMGDGPKVLIGKSR